MPLPLLERDVLGSGQTGDGFGAAHTLLGVQVAEAVQAVGVVLSGGEALAGQLLPAADAQEALAVPRFLLVRHPSCGNGLLAGAALVGKLLFEARHAEVARVFGDEGLGADWLLAPVAQEAGLVPAVALIFHFPGAWHDGLLAGGALGGIVVGVTLCAQQQLVFGSEGFLHQRAAAFGTLEALLMPVPVLVRQVLTVAANGRGASLAAVGEEVLIALGTVLRVVLHDVLLPQQGVFAVMAVEALVRHC